MNIEKDIEIVKETRSFLSKLGLIKERTAIGNVLKELEKKDKMIDLILGEYIDDRYDFQFIEPNKRADKRIELINEYKEHYRKKVQK